MPYFFPFPVYTTSGAICKFPFEFEGVQYDRCVTDIENSPIKGQPWCSLTSEYNGHYGQCDLASKFSIFHI